jgi:hypothetical protein
LEYCGFNHYSYVGSDDSNEAVDESLSAVIADSSVVDVVSSHACESWY